MDSALNLRITKIKLLKMLLLKKKNYDVVINNRIILMRKRLCYLMYSKQLGNSIRS